ncbi:MAG: hypothetical protein FH749_08395 [Firmicutes bacterium]|nr:hypothetical protein [Bacillota bacterium]
MKLDENIIRTIASRHGFNIDAEALDLNNSGMDFVTLFARAKKDNSKWVLRFPRRQDVLKRMDYERDVLELVKDQLQVEVPDWQVVTDEMVAYPLLSGIPAGTINPELGDYEWYIDSKSPPEAYVKSVAATLAELHGVRFETGEHTAIRVEGPEQVRQAMARNMDAIRELLGVSDARWARWQRWLANDALWPQHSVFMHGDFHPGHTLVDETGKLTGLIDWTEAAVNDPAKDFVVFYAAFGEGTLDFVLEQYQAAGGRVWPGMKEHIVERWNANPVDYALFALDTGKEEHIEGARESLAWTD